VPLDLDWKVLSDPRRIVLRLRIGFPKIKYHKKKERG
jgi:hypothetical protein